MIRIPGNVRELGNDGKRMFSLGRRIIVIEIVDEFFNSYCIRRWQFRVINEAPGVAV